MQRLSRFWRPNLLLRSLLLLLRSSLVAAKLRPRVQLSFLRRRRRSILRKRVLSCGAIARWAATSRALAGRARSLRTVTGRCPASAEDEPRRWSRLAPSLLCVWWLARCRLAAPYPWRRRAGAYRMTLRWVPTAEVLRADARWRRVQSLLAPRRVADGCSLLSGRRGSTWLAGGNFPVGKWLLVSLKRL